MSCPSLLDQWAMKGLILWLTCLPLHINTHVCILTCEEESVVRIPGWMLLGLEQCIKVPEAARSYTHLP